MRVSPPLLAALLFGPAPATPAPTDLSTLLTYFPTTSLPPTPAPTDWPTYFPTPTRKCSDWEAEVASDMDVDRLPAIVEGLFFGGADGTRAGAPPTKPVVNKTGEDSRAKPATKRAAKHKAVVNKTKSDGTVPVLRGRPALSGEVTTNIVGGEVFDLTEDQEYLVSMGVVQPLGYSEGGFVENNFHVCGGTLIAPNAVLSAASCFTDVFGNRVKLDYVEFKRNDHSVESNPGAARMYLKKSDIFRHPNFDPATGEYDLALVFLPMSLGGVKTARLNDDPRSPEAPGEVMEVSGWGATAYGVGSPSDLPRVAEVGYIPNAICEDRLFDIKPSMMCATGPPPDDASDCVVLGQLCDQNAPHFDPEGMVCANDGQEDEAYCNYSFGPTACVMCASTAKVEDPCLFDNGGPLVQDTPEGQVQVGVVSQPNCGAPAGEKLLTVEILTDDWPGETSWQLIRQCDGEVLTEVFPNQRYTQEYTPHSDSFLVPDDTWEFVIDDTWGDGICCDEFGDGGFYRVTYDGALVTFGDEFDYHESVVFGQDISPPCEAGQKLLTVDITTDDYPEETSWVLFNYNCDAVQVQAGRRYLDEATKYSESYCVPDNEYEFTIFDIAEDGICCNFGEGGYNVTYDGALVATGGVFGGSESTTFGNPQGECQPVECEKFPRLPSVYSRVSSGLDWIKDTVECRTGSPTSPPPAPPTGKSGKSGVYSKSRASKTSSKSTSSKSTSYYSTSKTSTKSSKSYYSTKSTSYYTSSKTSSKSSTSYYSTSTTSTSSKSNKWGSSGHTVYLSLSMSYSPSFPSQNSSEGR